ncbi:hypothetical protein [Bacillus sp. Bos-x628]|uniref:hypothetical protein n=1 Tax=Bacillus maqinnsis TaxID=3229854 RepID=UPI00338E9AC9
MTKERKTKNITMSLTKEEFEDLEYLVDYFQSKSIANVTKSLVVKFMISQTKETIEKNQLSNVRKLLDKAEKEPNFDIEDVEIGKKN